MLEPDELTSLRVLGYFYLQIKQYDSALRAVKAILAIYPKDEWAYSMLIRLYDILEYYDKVYEMTNNLSFLHDQGLKKGLLMLRARAMQKLDKTDEISAVLDDLQ